MADRRYLPSDDSMLIDQSNICATIGKSTGVKIELTNSKSKSLNVAITGTPAQVAKARVMIKQELSQQVCSYCKWCNDCS